MEQPVSYLNKRLQEMHLTDADTKTRLIYSVGEQVRESEVHFLTATDKDDIAITVYDLDRRVIEYDYRSDRQTDRVNDNAPLTRDYQVIRRSPKYLKEHPDAPKYMFPGGEEKKGTYPFLPPLLLDLYEQKREIDTLVLTEGYLKAIKACRCGIPCVGLGSVTLFADSRDGFLYTCTMPTAWTYHISSGVRMSIWQRDLCRSTARSCACLTCCKSSAM